MKKVSIIVPAHNTEKYISQCIESILCQTYHNIQLILIDDNSTDSTAEVLKRYKECDNRIVLKHVCAGSAGKARNYGLKEADGFYLAFVDSDDWIEPDYIEKLVSELEKNDCDCAMCGVSLYLPNGDIKQRVFSDNGKIFSGKDMREGTLISIAPDTKYNPTFYLWDKIYKRSLWENIVFDDELRNAEDRVALYNVFNDDVRTVVTQELLYNYRMSVGITSQKKAYDKHDDYVAVYKILKIAKEKNHELSPVYESIIVHTLGKARNLIRGRMIKQYNLLVDEFKDVYPYCKNEIRRADKKYKYASYLLKYFPKILYIGYVVFGKFLRRC